MAEEHNPRYYPSWQLGQDCYDGALSVAKACMLLSQQKRFVGCNLNSKSVTSRLPSLRLVCAWQVLNKELDIIEDNDVQKVAFKLVIAMKELVLKHRIGV